jgi:hypothetical protein
MIDARTMDRIGEEHGISPEHRVEFLRLANDGRIDNDEFGTRLCTCVNYEEACIQVMEVLSVGL